MKPINLEKGDLISQQFIENVCEQLAQDKRIISSFMGGRLSIDRQLPFLCLYRQPETYSDAGTERLVMSEAAYLVASGKRKFHRSLRQLVTRISALLSEIFGAFLIIEIWSSPEYAFLETGKIGASKPAFKIAASNDYRLTSTTEALQAALQKTHILKRTPKVEIMPGTCAPEGLRPILLQREAEQWNCHWLGLEVRPIHLSVDRQEEFPLVRRSLVRSLSRALQRAFYEFTRTQTARRPPNYQSLGKRAFVKAVWHTDQQLAAISDAFDLLIHLNPVNLSRSWSEFRRSKFEKTPSFLYPRLPIEPASLKRNLYMVPMEHIEDPAIEEIFRDKRDELDRQLTLLTDRGTPRFIYGSIQLYGGVDEVLFKSAKDLLMKIPSRTRDDSSGGKVTADEFAYYAKNEISRYKAELPNFTGTWQVYDGPASLMVSRGHLLIGSRISIPRRRIDALIQHEIGTHMVTYYNAMTQPFRMLHAGLAGYDELQEGLAVLAEYICGGLSRPRLRLLAARVVAVRQMIEGASFVDVFRELDRFYDFGQKTAFTITLRVFRGGGLTKDAAYLRGLIALLKYFKEGGVIEPLFVGKFALKHLPIIKELMARKVLHKPPLLPYYLRGKDTAKALELLRSGLSVTDLVGGRRR